MITLPWPPKELSPNARVHRMVKARQAKLYKEACWALAREKNSRPPPGRVHLKITFYPPTRQRRDLDNLLASIKAGIDGVAMAWQIDDELFRPITIDIAEHVGGMVKIEVVSARCGEGVSRLPHTQEIAGANPATATKMSEGCQRPNGAPE